MATAPVAYQSALIESLRAASPGFTSNNPGVTLLDNPANSKTVINFKRSQPPTLPPGPFVGPPLPPGPTPAPTPPPSPPVIGPGGPGGPPVIGPGPGPSIPTLPPAPPAPDPGVPDYTDDLWPPVEPDPRPDPDVTPPDGPWLPEEPEDVAQTFPVPDPAPPDVRDLPPLDDPVETFPVPQPSPWEPVELPPVYQGPDFVPPPQEDDVTVPDYTEDLWPPVYDEIPEGEIDVVAPGSSQPARDAIDNIGDITELGDPLDELGDIELPIPEIDPPPVPQPSDDASSNGSGDVYVRPSTPFSVSDNPLDEWDWIEPDIPEIPLPEIPAANFGDFNFSDAELLDMLFGDYFGGGGGGIGNMNLYMQE